MKFKVKWGDFKPLLNKKFVSEEESKSPIFYFETSEEIICYQANEGYTIWSSILLNSIEDLVAFKQEYLPQAKELLELPIKKNVLVIKQE